MSQALESCGSQLTEWGFLGLIYEMGDQAHYLCTRMRSNAFSLILRLVLEGGGRAVMIAPEKKRSWT